MQNFQANLQKLEAADTQVLGVSMDSPFSNAAWAEKINVTFPLLSDWGGDITRKYGLYDEKRKIGRRVNFLIDKEGKIAEMQIDSDAVDPAARAAGLRAISLTVILGTLGGRVGPRQQPWPPGDQPEKRMITYIGLLSFTDKGIQTVKDTTKRAAAAKEIAKKLGVNMREVFWTMGECDMVCVLEADDENALVAFNLATAVQGNVRSRSLRAYSAKDMDKILAKLP